MAEEIELSNGDDIRNFAGDDTAKIVYANDGDDLVLGTKLDDQLFGGDGDDSLTGAHGDDIVEGGGGADTMFAHLASRVHDPEVAGIGFDLLSYRNSPGGVFIDLVSGTGQGADASGDRFYQFDGAIGSRFDDRLVGDEKNNHLEGLAGNDGLNGGAGYDTLFGGAGNDTMHGGSGVDYLIGGIGSDVYNGGANLDYLMFNRDHVRMGDRDIIRSLEDGDWIVLSQFNDLTAHYEETVDGGVEITFTSEFMMFEYDMGYVIEVQNATVEEVQGSILLM